MSVISQFSSGGVKSVQSGVATVAGTTTISTVNIAKSVVTSVSKGTAVTTTTFGGSASLNNAAAYWDSTPGGFDQSGNITLYTRGMPGYNGTVVSHYPTAVTAKAFSARLTNATTITVDGPCEWQVVEYY
jgi:hypothetical protein